MATLTWIDFTKHNELTGESARAFSVNHPVAGRLVVIKGVNETFTNSMASIGFTKTKDGSWVIKASQLNLGALQKTVYPLLGTKNVELSEIDLTAQFVKGAAPAQEQAAPVTAPAIHPGLNWLSRSSRQDEKTQHAIFDGILPSSVAQSLWAHLDQSADKETLINGQTLYRGEVDGKAFLLVKRPQLLGGPQKVQFYEADNSTLLPDPVARLQAPAIFQLSDSLKPHLNEIGEFYNYTVGISDASDFTPSRKLNYTNAQNAINVSDTFEGVATKSKVVVDSPFVIASEEYSEGVTLRDLFDAFGQNEIASIVKSLNEDSWIIEPADTATSSLDPASVVRSSALVSHPEFLRTLRNRGADVAVYYRSIDADIQSREAFISENNIAMYVKPLVSGIAESLITDPLFNMSKVPMGFAILQGDGQRAGQIALSHTDTGELIRNGENHWFGSLIEAVESIELPENSFFVNPSDTDIMAAVNAAFLEPIDVIAFRGEHGENPSGPAFHTRGGSISFSNKEVATTYALEPNEKSDEIYAPRLIEARIQIRNPLMVDREDPFVDMSTLIKAIGAERTKTIALELSSYIKDTSNFEELVEEHAPDALNVSDLLDANPALLEKLYVDAYHVFDSKEWVEWFKEAGFDGAVHGGNNVSALEAEYKIFDHSQGQIITVTSLSQDEDLTQAAEPIDIEAVQAQVRDLVKDITDLANIILVAPELSQARIDALRTHTPSMIENLNQFGDSLQILYDNAIFSIDSQLPDLIEIGSPVISEVYNRIIESDVEMEIVSLSAYLSQQKSLAIIDPEMIVEKYAHEYRLYSTLILEGLGNSSRLPLLLKKAGLRKLEMFTHLPIEDQADIYGQFIAAGNNPVAVPDNYNDWVRSQEKAAEDRRVENQIPLAQQLIEAREAQGLPSYTDAQGILAEHLAIGVNDDGEYALTDEQFDSFESIVQKIIEGFSLEDLTKEVSEFKATLQTDGDIIPLIDYDISGHSWAIVSGSSILLSGSEPKKEFNKNSDGLTLNRLIDNAKSLNGDLYIGGYSHLKNPEVPDGLIFGKTWAEIQQMQQGIKVPRSNIAAKMPTNPIKVFSSVDGLLLSNNIDTNLSTTTKASPNASSEQLEAALDELVLSRNFFEANIEIDKENNSWLVFHRGWPVARMDEEPNRNTVQVALLRELGIDDYVNSRFYTKVAENAEQLLWLQDVLDPVFTERHIAIRNYLTGIGYQAKDRSPVVFSPSGESTVRTEFKQVGAGRNVVGATYHVGDKKIVDDLSKSTLTIGQELNDWVIAGEAEIQKEIAAESSIVDLSNLATLNDLKTALLSGKVVVDREKSYSVVETMNSGWTIVESEAGVSVTKGGDPRGGGYSKSEAVERVADNLSWHYLIEDQEVTPVTVYHGSNNHALTALEPINFYNAGMFGKGINLTSSIEDARKYASSNVIVNPDIISKADVLVRELRIPYENAKAELTKGEGRIYEAQLSLTNPLVINSMPLNISQDIFRLAAIEADYPADQIERLYRRFSVCGTGELQFDLLLRNNATKIYRQIALLQNNDGLIIEPSIAPKGHGATHYLAFDSSQVTSLKPLDIAPLTQDDIPEIEELSAAANAPSPPENDVQALTQAELAEILLNHRNSLDENTSIYEKESLAALAQTVLAKYPSHGDQIIEYFYYLAGFGVRDEFRKSLSNLSLDMHDTPLYPIAVDWKVAVDNIDRDALEAADWARFYEPSQAQFTESSNKSFYPVNDAQRETFKFLENRAKFMNDPEAAPALFVTDDALSIVVPSAKYVAYLEQDGSMLRWGAMAAHNILNEFIYSPLVETFIPEYNRPKQKLKTAEVIPSAINGELVDEENDQERMAADLAGKTANEALAAVMLEVLETLTDSMNDGQIPANQIGSALKAEEALTDALESGDNLVEAIDFTTEVFKEISQNSDADIASELRSLVNQSESFRSLRNGESEEEVAEDVVQGLFESAPAPASIGASQDLFGNDLPDNLAAITISNAPSPKFILVTGDGLVHVDKRLDDLGGKYLKTMGGYRFNKSTESDVRRMLYNQSMKGQFTVIDNIRRPFDLRLNAKVSDRFGHRLTVTDIQRRPEGYLNVALTRDGGESTSDLVVSISHTTAELMQGEYDLTISNWDELNNLYPVKQNEIAQTEAQDVVSDDKPEQSVIALVNAVATEQPAPQSEEELFPEFAVLRGVSVERIGKNNINDFLYRSEDGLRFILNSDGVVTSENPFVTPSGEFTAPSIREDKFKLLAELEAEVVIANNVVRLRTTQDTEHSNNELTEIKSPEEIEKNIEKVGLNRAVLHDYFVAYSKLRHEQDDNLEPNEFTLRRLTGEVNKAFNVLNAMAGKAGYVCDRALLEGMADKNYSSLSTLANKITNGLYKLAIDRVMDEKPFVSLQDAIELDPFNARALPPHWVNKQLKKCLQRNDYAAFSVFLAKVYGTPEDQSQAASLVEAQDPIKIQELADQLQAKYGKIRDLVELPSMIKEIDREFNNYRGASPIPRRHMENLLGEHFENLAKAQYDIDAIEISEDDISMYRTTGSYSESNEKFAQKHGITYDAAKVYSSRVEALINKRLMDEFKQSEEFSVIQRASVIMQSRLPEGVKISFGETPDEAHIRFEFGAGTITVSRPDKRYDNDQFRVGFHFSAARHRTSQFNRSESFAYSGMPTPEQVAQDGLSFAQLCHSPIKFHFAPTYGSKANDLPSDRRGDTTFIAKQVREDIKKAISSGHLPKGLKVGIRSDRNSVRVTVKELPAGFILLNPEYAAYRAEHGQYEPPPHNMDRHSYEVNALFYALEGYLNAYNVDNSDPYSGYSNVRYYSSLSFDPDLSDASYEAALAAAPNKDADNNLYRLLTQDTFWNLKHFMDRGFTYVGNRRVGLEFNETGELIIDSPRIFVPERVTDPETGLTIPASELADPLLRLSFVALQDAYKFENIPFLKGNDQPEIADEQEQAIAAPVVEGSAVAVAVANDGEPGILVIENTEDSDFYADLKTVTERMEILGAIPTVYPSPIENNFNRVYIANAENGLFESLLNATFDAGDSKGVLIHATNGATKEDVILALAVAFEDYAVKAFQNQQAAGMADSLIILNNLEGFIGRHIYTSRLIVDAERKIAAKGVSAVIDYYQGLLNRNVIDDAVTPILFQQNVVVPAIEGFSRTGEFTLGQLENGRYVWGTSVELVNGATIKEPLTASARTYDTAEDAAAAFIQTFANLNGDAEKIANALTTSFADVVPANTVTNDLPIPDLTNVEAYNVMRLHERRMNKLGVKLSEADTPEDRAAVEAEIAQAEKENTEALVVHVLKIITDRPMEVDRLNAEYVQGLAAAYPELRKAWNYFHLLEAGTNLEPDSKLLPLWMQLASFGGTHVLEGEAIHAAQSMPVLESMGVTESVNTETLESTFTFDLGEIETESRETFTNQARLAGALVDGDTLRFSSQDNLDLFVTENNMKVAIKESLEVKPSAIDTTIRNGNISADLKLELEKAGYLQTQEENIWLTTSENDAAIQVTFLEGAVPNTFDTKIRYAKYGHKEEGFVEAMDHSTNLNDLELLMAQELESLHDYAIKRPAFTPSYNEINGEEICQIILGAGLNVEETKDNTWIISGNTYPYRNQLNLMGGDYDHPDHAKPQWAFKEPPAKKLAVVIGSLVDKANPITEIDGFLVTVSYNANDNHFETVISKGNPDEKLIIGVFSSLSKARTAILASILDSDKLAGLWRKTYPTTAATSAIGTTTKEESVNERSDQPTLSSRESNSGQNAPSAPVGQRAMANEPDSDIDSAMVGESRGTDQRGIGSGNGTSNSNIQQPSADTGSTPASSAGSNGGATPVNGRILGDARDSILFDLRASRLDRAPTSQELGLFTLEALRTLQNLRSSKRPATPEEQIKLSRMVGLGAGQFNSGPTSIFNGYQKNHVNASIRETIYKFKNDEIQSLRNTVLTAFYTPETITDFMWEGLNRMGLSAINRTLDIVDPGVGTGNFIGSAPDAIRRRANFHGVECDAVTAEIASHLYPEARIINREFQDVLYPANSKDLFIGNPPYSDVRTFNPNTGKREVLHDLFLRESIVALREGGFTAFVTSSGTLDKKNSSLREFVHTQADLVAAFRLPNSAFKADAGTEVMTDILFFRKRKANEPALDSSWVKTVDYFGGEDSRDIRINQYFVNNPQNVLGELTIVSGRFGDVLSCEGNGTCLKELLNDALATLPENMFNPSVALTLVNNSTKPEIRTAMGETLADGVKVGELIIGNNDEVQVIRYDGSNAQYYMTPAPVKANQLPLLRDYISLRDKARALIDLERKPETAENNVNIDNLRAALNVSYDQFIATHGPLGRKATNRILRQDPGYYFTAQLEIYDKDTDQAKKADIFNRRVINSVELPQITNPMDAAYYSISNYGHIEPRIVEDLLGQEWSTIREDLGDKIFLDPKSGKYYSASIYLSGDVIDKIEAAERALISSPEMERNIEALKAVVPKTIPITDIRIKIGATWIPESTLTDFVREILKANDYKKKEKCYVEYNDILKTWNFKVTDMVLRDASQRNHIEYGTDDYPFHKLFKCCLEQTRPTVTIELANGQRAVHPERTQAARDKQVLIEETFNAFILNDTNRAEKVEKSYNYRMNRFVPNKPDGKYLTFPGLSAELKGKPFVHGAHQLGVIEKALTSEYGLLIAHEAGGGKTISTVTIGIKNKQLGLANKPMVAVPNHMLVQYTLEALDVYPNARILTVSKDDLTAEGREQFAYKCLMNDWDLVICTHEQFSRMKMPGWYVEQSILNEISELEELILSNDDKITTKQLERQKRSLNEKLESHIAEMEKNKDDIDFTSLGIDWIGYDEAHYLKNRAFPTKNSSLAGVQSITSQRARDAEMKFDWIRESRGDSRGVLLATGTPISNTIGEIMVILRYTAPELLARAGIHNFDDFIANYGETKIHVELTADGSGYQLKERLSGFHNIPELMKLFIQVADIKMGDQLDLVRPNENRITRVSNMSPEQQLFMDWLSYRARAVKSGEVEPHKDNMLSIYTDLQTISIDPRLYHHKLADLPGSKINMEVESIFESWEKGHDNLDTQLIFVDRFQKTVKVPDGKDNKGREKFKPVVTFNLIEDMKAKLIAKGIPANQIGSIHDTKTDDDKEEFFSQIRQGKVRITFASTAKMGVGTNVQTRGKDLRHLSYPMRSIDIEQRNKRFVRQGNMNDSVNLHYPTTKDSGDLGLLQMIERKDKMTRQIMSCDFENMSRSFDEDFTPSYEDIMAITTGNTVIKDKLETDSLVDKYRRQRKAHGHQCYEYRRVAKDLTEKQIPDIEKYIAKSREIAKIIDPAEFENFSMKIEGTTYTQVSLAGAAIHAVAHKIKVNGTYKEVGTYLGKPLSIGKNDHGGYYLGIKVADVPYVTEITENIRYFPSRLGFLIQKRVEGIEEGVATLEKYKTDAAEAIEKSQQPFPHEAALAEAEAKLAKLNVELAKIESETEKVVYEGLHPFEELLAQLDGKPVEQQNKVKSNSRLLSQEEIIQALNEEGLNSDEVEKVKELTLTR